MDTLTLEEKLGQMLVVGFQRLQAPPHIVEWLGEGRIGGVILFARNIESPGQLEAVRRLGQLGTLVCLRNPYDAGVISAGTVLLTLGDSAPSLRAAADALLGDYRPMGRLNVPLTM